MVVISLLEAFVYAEFCFAASCILISVVHNSANTDNSENFTQNGQQKLGDFRGALEMREG